jgi:hypothetical protein
MFRSGRACHHRDGQLPGSISHSRCRHQPALAAGGCLAVHVYCLDCGSELEVIAATVESAAIQRSLTQLGLRARSLPWTPARERQVAHAACSRLDALRPLGPAPRDDEVGCDRHIQRQPSAPGSAGSPISDAAGGSSKRLLQCSSGPAIHCKFCRLTATLRCPGQPSRG